MRFEWDSAKNNSNLRKHGIGFEEAALIWQGPLLIELDHRDYDEERYIAIGLLASSVVLVVVYTERHNMIRIISARKATPNERKRFYEKIHRGEW